MAASDDNGNGKVTMAVIGSKLDTMSEQMSILIKKFDDHLVTAAKRDERISLIEQRNTGADKKLVDITTSINEHEKRMDAISIRSNIWDGANSLITSAVGALLLWIKGQ